MKYSGVLTSRISGRPSLSRELSQRTVNCIMDSALSPHDKPRTSLSFRSHFASRSPVIVVSRPMNGDALLALVAHDMIV